MTSLQNEGLSTGPLSPQNSISKCTVRNQDFIKAGSERSLIGSPVLAFGLAADGFLINGAPCILAVEASGTAFAESGTMARQPNYDFERRERDRLKKLKNAERAEARLGAKVETPSDEAGETSVANASDQSPKPDAK
jgi:hypothetical protein